MQHHDSSIQLSATNVTQKRTQRLQSYTIHGTSGPIVPLSLCREQRFD